MYRYKLDIGERMFEKLKQDISMILGHPDAKPERDYYYGAFFINKLCFDIRRHNHTFYFQLAELDDSGNLDLWDGQCFSLRTKTIDQISYHIGDGDLYGLIISYEGMRQISHMNTIDELRICLLKNIVVDILSWLDNDSKNELYESEDFWGDHL